jgi:hypothetical protein
LACKIELSCEELDLLGWSDLLDEEGLELEALIPNLQGVRVCVVYAFDLIASYEHKLPDAPEELRQLSVNVSTSFWR